MSSVLKVGISTFAGVLLLAGWAYAASMLTDNNGMTLYTYDKDKKGVSECYDKCAANWPPYMATKGQKMPKGWTMIKRKDGKMQWSYDDKPLYTFVGDKKKGDKTGDGMNGVWHAAKE